MVLPEGAAVAYERGTPVSGDEVKFDPREVLGKSWGPTVGHMILPATYGTGPEPCGQ